MDFCGFLLLNKLLFVLSTHHKGMNYSSGLRVDVCSQRFNVAIAFLYD